MSETKNTKTLKKLSKDGKRFLLKRFFMPMAVLTPIAFFVSRGVMRSHELDKAQHGGTSVIAPEGLDYLTMTLQWSAIILIVCVASLIIGALIVAVMRDYYFEDVVVEDSVNESNDDESK